MVWIDSGMRFLISPGGIPPPLAAPHDDYFYKVFEENWGAGSSGYNTSQATRVKISSVVDLRHGLSSTDFIRKRAADFPQEQSPPQQEQCLPRWHTNLGVCQESKLGEIMARNAHRCKAWLPSNQILIGTSLQPKGKWPMIIWPSLLPHLAMRVQV